MNQDVKVAPLKCHNSSATETVNETESFDLGRDLKSGTAFNDQRASANVQA